MYTNLFYDLHMISASEGWAVGTSGRVLRYDGTNWSNQTTPASADLYSVSFSASNNGFMTGRNSTVYHYNGSSWTTHGTSLPDNSFHVYSVTTVSSSLAYAATTPGFGGAGIIMIYNGSVWTTDYEFTGMGSELFYGIHFPFGSKGYAVGAGGMVKTKGTAPVGIEEENNSIKTNVYPNPFTNQFVISFDAENATDMRIVLLDISGKMINEITNQKIPQGNFTITYDGSDLENGMYFVQLITENKTETLRLVKN